MIVVYRLATMVVEHCVHVSGPDYQAFIEADPERGCVEVEGTYQPDEIGVEMVGDAPAVFVRERFGFDVPNAASAGTSIHISGIPSGTQITFESGSMIMDDAGMLDLTFSDVGDYELSFTHPRYVSMLRTIAVTA